VVPESEVITSFYLRPRDGGPIMAFRPGQYLTFQLDIPGHGQVVRNYSVSCAPGQDSYRISVKREGAPDDAPQAPAGLASNYLHDQGGPGTLVRVSAPAGDFFLAEQDGRPLVLLSGGVGLTPTLSMLDTLVTQGGQRDIWYVHAALSGRHHAMKQHLKEVVAAHPGVRSVVFYEFPTPDDVRGRDYDEPGRITMDWLKQTVPVAGPTSISADPRGSCGCWPSVCVRWTSPMSGSISNSSVQQKPCMPDAKDRRDASLRLIPCSQLVGAPTAAPVESGRHDKPHGRIEA
jgi:nitric oxide dioxygenase